MMELLDVPCFIKALLFQLRDAASCHAVRRKFIKKLKRKHARVISARKRDLLLSSLTNDQGSSAVDSNATRSERSVHDEPTTTDDMVNEKEEAALREAEANHKDWLSRELKARIEFERRKLKQTIKQRKDDARRQAWLGRQDILAKIEHAKKSAFLNTELIMIGGRNQFHHAENSEICDLPENGSAPNDILVPTTSASDGWSGYHQMNGDDHIPNKPGYNGSSSTSVCRIFELTGTCRNGSVCRRSHPVPESSSTIILPNMFVDNFGSSEKSSKFPPAPCEKEDLEREDVIRSSLDRASADELRDAVSAFREDVHPELTKYGAISRLEVAVNSAPHLRGTVFVEFRRRDNAVMAMAELTGRWFDGKRLAPEFRHRLRWHRAICGSFARNFCCPAGRYCNFIHRMPCVEESMLMTVKTGAERRESLDHEKDGRPRRHDHQSSTGESNKRSLFSKRRSRSKSRSWSGPQHENRGSSARNVNSPRRKMSSSTGKIVSSIVYLPPYHYSHDSSSSPPPDNSNGSPTTLTIMPSSPSDDRHQLRSSCSPSSRNHHNRRSSRKDRKYLEKPSSTSAASPKGSHRSERRRIAAKSRSRKRESPCSPNTPATRAHREKSRRQD